MNHVNWMEAKMRWVLLRRGKTLAKRDLRGKLISTRLQSSLKPSMKPLLYIRRSGTGNVQSSTLLQISEVQEEYKLFN